MASLGFWLCDWLDPKKDFTPTRDFCCTRSDFYPWGDCLCCGEDFALCSAFELEPLPAPPTAEGDWTIGFFDCFRDDFVPVMLPRAWCCPCCVAAENFRVMDGGRADGWCGEDGAKFCCCMFICYLTGASLMVPVCTVVERRFLMKRYNLQGRTNPCCWLLGVCHCCALYQHRALVIAKHDAGPSSRPLLGGAVNKQPTAD